MPRDLPIRALQAFALVYECRGIRAAARELRITHSSLSRHVRELTRWVGVPLVLQGGGRGGLRFTPQGEALGRASLVALRSIERVSESFREARHSHSVAIETTSSVAVRWLLPRLTTFEAAHPGIEVSVVADQKLNDPDGTNIDFSIRMGSGPWNDVDCKPLMRETLYPVMTPQLWRQCGRPARAHDLGRLRLLHDRDPHTTWETWRNAVGPPTLDARKGPRFTSSDLVLSAAAQGQGVALARDRLVRDDIKAGLLMRPFGSAHLDLGIAYWIILPAHRRVRPAVATVITWLNELVEAEDRGAAAAKPRL
ncbi:MAG TPA: LysR substrate-binding domain-containing protein [Steroidobacteraceae bacterium]|nr:LysR substrate-binding domain-containing protein [Steroidobacteraceae bacterium]